MKKIFATLILSALSTVAFGQSYIVDEQLDSIKAPFSSTVTYAASIQFEAPNAAGNLVTVGTATKLPSINFVADSAIVADIAGNKGSVLTVSALRVTFAATGGAGWELVSPVPVRKRFAAPFAIAAGQKVGCRYDMPMQTYTFDPKTLTLAWAPGGKGRLRCQPGLLAASIPPPGTVAPAPPPTLTFAADPQTVVIGNSALLTWSTTNANSCTGSGAWSGTKATTGSQSTGTLIGNATFTLGCSGIGGDVTKSIIVVVSNPPTIPPPGPRIPSPAGACITPNGAATTDGDGCAAPLVSLVDSTGGLWTLTLTTAMRENVNTRPALDNFGYWPLSYIYIRPTGVLCGFNANHGDICWTGGKWQ